MPIRQQCTCRYALASLPLPVARCGQHPRCFASVALSAVRPVPFQQPTEISCNALPPGAWHVRQCQDGTSSAGPLVNARKFWQVGSALIRGSHHTGKNGLTSAQLQSISIMLDDVHPRLRDVAQLLIDPA